MDLHIYWHFWFYFVSDWNENQWHRTLLLPDTDFADESVLQKAKVLLSA